MEDIASRMNKTGTFSQFTPFFLMSDVLMNSDLVESNKLRATEVKPCGLKSTIPPLLYCLQLLTRYLVRPLSKITSILR